MFNADISNWYERYCTAYHAGQDVALYHKTGMECRPEECLGWYMWVPAEGRHEQIDLYIMRRVWGWSVDECKEFVRMFDKEEYLS